MKLECVVLMDKRRIHIYDKEDTVDVFDEFTENETYEDAIVRCGYKVDQLNIKVVGAPLEKEHVEVQDLMSVLPKTTYDIERCKGAHRYFDTYIGYFKSIDERIECRTNPVIMKDYAISKANYPEGIELRISTPEACCEEITKLFDALLEDLDMVTDEVADLRLIITKF